MALVAVVSAAQAQTTYPNVKVTGRLQEQFYYFGNEDYAGTVGPKSNIFTRRARIEARGNISENVSGWVKVTDEAGREGWVYGALLQAEAPVSVAAAE